MSCDDKLPAGWIRVKSKSRPDKEFFHNQKLNMSLWKIEDLKKFETLSKPSPTKRVSPRKASHASGLSDESKVIKKNVARDRLTKLQNVLALEAKRGVRDERKSSQTSRDNSRVNSKVPVKVDKKNIAAQRLCKLKSTLTEDVQKAGGDVKKNGSTSLVARQKPEVPMKFVQKNVRRNEKQLNVASKSEEETSQKPKVPFENSKEVQPKFSLKQPKLVLQEPEPGDECTDVDMLDLSSQGTPKPQPEPYEAMDWEDVPEHEVISKVQKIRTCESDGRSSSLVSAPKRNSSLSKTDFYIVVDTNVLLSNIDFIKDIKGKLFKDIGKATIYLPYIVLCELDKIKSYNDKLGMLARRAVEFINDCLVKKDAFLIGQSGKESFQKQIIPIDSGDDEILNCCLHIQEATEKVILLSNDRNLRNKAFVNKIETFSRDTLNYMDFNVKNEIKFESN